MPIKIALGLAAIVLVLFLVQALYPAPPGSPTGLRGLSQITLAQIEAMREKLSVTLPIDFLMIGAFLAFGWFVFVATKGDGKPQWLTCLGFAVLLVVLAQALVDVAEDITLYGILQNPSESAAASVRKLFWPKMVLFALGYWGGLIVLGLAFFVGRKS